MYSLFSALDWDSRIESVQAYQGAAVYDCVLMRGLCELVEQYAQGLFFIVAQRG